MAKVDVENRLVSGFATLDNLDSQGDVVLAEASQKAFARARGNIREMHQPIAVGHIVDFNEEEYYDTENKEFYRGIFVTAYVSKGASDTWEKVLDGTLTGFSIGGEILDSEKNFVKDVDATVRFIKDYELIELSLVDNPANPLANVFSIQKSAEGSVTLKGMVADTNIENIFLCQKEGAVKTFNGESVDCSFCGEAMENIGWVETGPEKSEKIREVVDKFLASGKDAEAAENAHSEGGVTVSKNENKDAPNEGEVVAGVDEGREVEPGSGDDTNLAEGEKNEDGILAAEEGRVAEGDNTGEVVAGIDEVPDENEEIQKKMESLMSSIDESLEKNRNETANVVSALEEKVETLTKSMDTKISEFETKLEELDKSLATAKSAVSDFEKNLDKMNSAGAFRKSGEVEKTEPEIVQKDDDWAGAFSVKNLFK